MEGRLRRIVKTILGNVLIAALFLQPLAAYANPQGGVVDSGNATIVEDGKNLNIHQTTDKVVIDWRSFDINADESTNFFQPNSSSIALNRVGGNNASQIFGKLTANGNVVIVNPNGVMFGAGSKIDVNGIVATTADISNTNFMNGDMRFDKAGNPDAAIINKGEITAKQAGLVGLVAPNVVNSGVISADLGRVQLSSGDTVTVDFYGDKLMEVAVSDDVKNQLVENTGTIRANGGKIALTAAAGAKMVNSLIRVEGELTAPAVGVRNGEIIIYAEGSNKTNKTGGSKVTVAGTVGASGNNAGEKGGKIDILGDDITVKSGAVINASGANGGGNIRIGGDYKGEGATATALNTRIENGALIKNNATVNGDGGRTIVWADNRTDFKGRIEGKGAGAGKGGFVETSGKNELAVKGGSVNLTSESGNKGTWLLDPIDIYIVDRGQSSDGVNTFNSSDLEDMSLGANVDLLASNNIYIDLNFDFVSLDTNSNLTLTAGNDMSFVNGGQIYGAGTGAFSFNADHNITVDGDYSFITEGAGTEFVAGNDITINNSYLEFDSGGFTLSFVKAGGNVNITDSSLVTFRSYQTLDIKAGENGPGAGDLNITNSTLGGKFQDQYTYLSATGDVNVTDSVLKGESVQITASKYNSVHGNKSINLLGTTTFDFYRGRNGQGLQLLASGNSTADVHLTDALLGSSDEEMGTIIISGFRDIYFDRDIKISGGFFNVDANRDFYLNGNLTFDTIWSPDKIKANNNILLSGDIDLDTLNLNMTGTVLVSGDRTIKTDGGTIAITGRLRGAIPDQDLTIDAGSTGTVTLDNSNSTSVTALRDLSITASRLNTSGYITNFGTLALDVPDIVLTGNQTFDGSAGNITTNGTINGNATLSIDKGTVNLGGALGNTTALSTLSIYGANGVTTDAITTNNSNINISSNNAAITIGNLLYAGTASVMSYGGNVTFNGTVDAQGTAYLGVNAGAGTLTFNGIVGGTNILASTGLTSDNLVINADMYGTGSLTYSNSTSGRTMGLGDGATGLNNISSASLGNIKDGWALTTFNSATGAMDIGAHTWMDNVTFTNIGTTGITVSGAQNFNANNAVFNSRGAITLNSTLTGTGNVNFRQTFATAAMNIGSLAGDTYGGTYMTDASLAQLQNGFNQITFQAGATGNMAFGTYSAYEFFDPTVFTSGGNASTFTIISDLVAGNNSNASFTINGGATGNRTLNLNANIDTSAATSNGSVSFNNYTNLNSSGNITTNGGNITFNNGITAINLTGDQIWDAGTGTLSTRTTNGAYNLGLEGGTVTINNTIGGNVALTSINIAADNLTLGGSVGALYTNDNITIKTKTAGMQMSVGSGINGLKVTDSILNKLSFAGDGTGYLQLGDSTDTGDMDINTGSGPWADTRFITRTGSDITLSSDMTFYADTTLDSGRDILLNSNLRYGSAGTNDLLLKAKRDITLAGGKDISTTAGGQVNITLQADSDADGVNGGAIKLGDIFTTGTAINSNGGNVVLGGGTNIVTGFAQGNSTNPYGINIYDADINAGNGAITMRGKGYDGSSGAQYGVYFYSNLIANGGVNITGYGSGTVGLNYGTYIDTSTIDTSGGSGTINITGYGSQTAGTTPEDYGVFITDSNLLSAAGGINVSGFANALSTGDYNIGLGVANSLLRSTTGNIALSGTGAGSTIGFGAYLDNSIIKTTDSGNITISGTGSTISDSSNYGLYLLNGSSISSDNGGNVTLTGASTGSTDIFSESYGADNSVGSSTTGEVSLIANNLSLNDFSGITSGSNIIIKTRTSGTQMSVGSATNGLQVDNTLLGKLVWGNSGYLQLGDATNTGAMDINTTNVFGNAVRFLTKSSSDITLSGDLTGSKDITFDSGRDISLNGSISKTGAATSELLLKAKNDISLAGGKSISSSTGKVNVTIQSDSDATNGGAIVIGDGSTTGTAISSNGGDIILSGGTNVATGFAEGNAANNSGIMINMAGINSGAGAITLRGKGYGGTNGSNYGVALTGAWNGIGSIVGNGAGNIDITGIGGGSGTSSDNIGVNIYSYATVRNNAADGGTITITGYGGEGSGGGNSAVRVNGIAGIDNIYSTHGDIFINANYGIGGQAITSSTGDGNMGLMSGGIITTNGDADINITAIGGGNGAGSNHGLSNNWGTIRSTAANGGDINVTAYGGGNGGSGSYNHGIFMSGNTGIESLDGNINVNANTGLGGQAVTNASGTSNYGMLLQGGMIKSTGNATINVNSVAGSGTGDNNIGISFYAGGNITSTTGDIHVTGTGGTNSWNQGAGVLFENNGYIISNGAADIYLTGIAGNANGKGIWTYGAATPGAGIGGGGMTGDIHMITDSLSFAAGSIDITTQGDIIINPYTTGTNVNVGSNTGGLDINDDALGQLHAGGYIQIGEAVKTAAIDINTSTVFANALRFLNKSGSDITVSGALESTNDITFDSGSDLLVNAAVVRSGTDDGALLFKAKNDIKVDNNVYIGSGSAKTDLTFQSDSDATNGGAIVLGTGLCCGFNLQSHNGNIILSGGTDVATGFAQGNSTNNTGIWGAYGQINAGTGAITMRGKGYSGSNDGNAGIYLGPTMIEVSGTNDINIIGIGGGNGGSSSYNYGVRNKATIYSTAASNGGAINITGYAGGFGGNGSYNMGVFNDGDGDIQSNTGDITINANYGLSGQAVSDATGTDNDGFRTNFSLLSTYGSANILVNALAVRGTGIAAHAGGQISSTGTNGGTITLNGYGNEGYGMLVSQTNLTSKDGNITINANQGLAGHATPTGNGTGVAISGGIESYGDATITINTVGGSGNNSFNNGLYIWDGAPGIRSIDSAININARGGSGNGGSNSGIRFSEEGGIYTSGNAPINITGIAGGGAGSYGIQLQNTWSAMTNTIGGANAAGDITLIADSLVLGTGANVQTTGNVIIKPYTADTQMSIGSASGNNGLKITDDELARLNWGSNKYLQLGDATHTGAMEINTANAFTKAVRFLTRNGSDITLSGNLSTSGNIIMDSGNDIKLNAFITKTGATASDFLLKADNNITTWTNSGVTSSTGAINLTLQSDADEDGTNFGSISLTNTSIDTFGGDLIFSGGSDIATGYAHGNAAQQAGVNVWNSSISTRNGDITMRGIGDEFNEGGGVQVFGSNINSGTGNISLLGYSDAGAGGAGLKIDSSAIRSTTGNMRFEGNAPNTFGSGGQGIRFLGSNTTIGDSGTSGDITFATDTNIMITGGVDSIETSGDIYIKTSTANTSLNINAVGGYNNQDILSVLDWGTDKHLYIGDSNTGNINLNSTVSFSKAVEVRNKTGYDITVAGALNNTATGNALTFLAGKDLIINQAITANSEGAKIHLRADNAGTGTGTVIFNGAGHVTAGANGNIDLLYNPSDYTTPTDYSSKLTVGTGGRKMAYMLVNDVNDLQSLSANPWNVAYGSYALGKDIDASITSTWNGGLGFNPVMFGGDINNINENVIFNGFGHSIDGLTINRPGQDNVGLFSVISASMVRNLSLTNVSITGNQGVGALAGFNYGTLDNINVSGHVTGNEGVGGILGGTSYYTYISNMHNSATVVGGAYRTGGIAGTNNGTIAYSSNTGTITGTQHVGGIAGFAPGLITQSYNTGTINGTTATGGVAGSAGTVSYSYNLGDVNIGSGGSYSGGLTGYYEVALIDSYNAGHVTIGAGTSNISALGSKGLNATIEDSYYDNQVSGIGDSDGVGLSTAQMKAGLPAGFDPSVWVSDGTDYPSLMWQNLVATETFTGTVTGSGYVNSILKAVYNGTSLAGTATVNSDGTYTYKLNAGTIQTGDILLAYLDSGATGNTIYKASATGNQSGVNMETGGLKIISPSDAFTLAEINAAKGSMTGSKIVYSVNNNTLTTTGNLDVEALLNGNTPVTLSAAGNINVKKAITLTGANTLKLRSDNDGNGVGNVIFSGTGHATVGNNGAVDIYYNTADYTTPTDYSGDVTLGAGALLTAYMLVNNVNDLQDIDTNLAGNYALGRNIDASVTAGWNSGAGFKPIGDHGLDATSQFSGIFDGQNFTISSLYINAANQNEIGLFGHIATTGLVRNVGLINANVNGTNYVANTLGIIAGTNEGAISNVYATGVVGATGIDVVGGLVGWNAGTIDLSHSNVAVTGRTSTGGIVGYNVGNVSRSYNNGTISGYYNGTGGIVGNHAAGSITSSYNTGAVSGVAHVGGIVGSSTANIAQTYNTGKVSGHSYVGGLIGFSAGGVSESYNTGYVTSLDTATLGGLVGVNYGTLTSTYWNTETSGQNLAIGVNYNAAAGTGLTTAEFIVGLPTGFDNTVWASNGSYYPYLIALGQLNAIDFIANNATGTTGTTPTLNGYTFLCSTGCSFADAVASGVLGVTTTANNASTAGSYEIGLDGSGLVLDADFSDYAVNYFSGFLVLSGAIPSGNNVNVPDTVTYTSQYTAPVYKNETKVEAGELVITDEAYYLLFSADDKNLRRKEINPDSQRRKKKKSKSKTKDGENKLGITIDAALHKIFRI